MAKKNEIIYGVHAVRHALSHNSGEVLSLQVQRNKKETPVFTEILNSAARQDLPIEYVPRDTLDRLTSNAVHQGILLNRKFQSRETTEDLDSFLDQDRDDNPFLLILDGIQDPHNLGACLRTANAAGVHAVIIPRDKSVKLSPTVHKVASGAVEDTAIITVTNLSRSMVRLKEAGFWLIGTDNAATQSLYDVDLTMPLAIVLGSEGKGLRNNTRKKCDYLVSLPMHGIVESLNVSVVAGVCLYEVLRQRLSG
jgi:23S rRNA (guanosine2251-2'-O)-methyltransferase